MTDRAKKISELSTTNAISNFDLLILESYNANGTIIGTKTISIGDLRKALIKGPYANNTAANTAGVLVGQPYYNANGAVFIRTA